MKLRERKNIESAKSAEKKHKNMIHLKEKYQKQIIPAMKEKFGYKNSMAVPRIEKVVVNTGFGRISSEQTGKDQEKNIEYILNDLSLICGQSPVKTKAKKSIAGFKLREGMIVGAKVTLRGRKMYDFLERLINITLPRSRDFRGIDQKAIDENGNLTIGIKEHICFPEVSPEKAKSIFGLEITITINAKDKEKGIELLKLFGFPLKS